jgi:Putative beta barrel porin-7 (BBP7)
LDTQFGTVVPSNPAPTADDVSYIDSLGVHNQFFVPQVGLTAGATYARFFCEATGKLGLGLVYTTAKGEGSTTQQTGGTSMTQAGGVLVPPSGLVADADRFTVVPEFSLTGGYQVASWCRVTVGYNILYATDGVRVSSLVGAVDDRQVPQLPTYSAAASAASAAPHLQGSSFWAQGLTAGLEFRY